MRPQNPIQSTGMKLKVIFFGEEGGMSVLLFYVYGPLLGCRDKCLTNKSSLSHRCPYRFSGINYKLWCTYLTVAFLGGRGGHIVLQRSMHVLNYFQPLLVFEHLDSGSNINFQAIFARNVMYDDTTVILCHTMSTVNTIMLILYESLDHCILSDVLSLHNTKCGSHPQVKIYLPSKHPKLCTYRVLHIHPGIWKSLEFRPQHIWFIWSSSSTIINIPIRIIHNPWLRAHGVQIRLLDLLWQRGPINPTGKHYKK